MMTYNWKGGGSVLVRYSYENPSRFVSGGWDVDPSGHYSTFLSPK